ncbi:MAG: hypothetical protein Ct9H90mP15_00360 [Candidatus Neomarinimicrobiota bacterium]|nr:MAG: hypothetical protein Ct9H90mP15_00360 [Candidatus Neomarinimicrobiota bacterium]
MLHPIAPFITEEIWSYLKDKSDNDIIVSSWPECNQENVIDKVEIIDTLKDVVTSIRTIRSELNIPPSKKIDFSYIH